MEIKKAKKQKVEPRSKTPYKRRSEAEISRILAEISEGLITIRGACKNFGLNRNTRKLLMVKSSIRNLDTERSPNFINNMNQN